MNTPAPTGAAAPAPAAAPAAAPGATVPGAAVAKPEAGHSLVAKFANRYGVEPNKLLATLKATAFKQKEGEVTNEQMVALLVVADQYRLNPFTREIFAFPDKNNGIVPVVSVDGWSRIINERPELDGIEFRYSESVAEKGDERFPGLKHRAHEWVECIIHRKDRAQPIVIREFLEEVYRAPFIGKRGQPGEYTIDSAWQSHTNRFLRHKTLIQASRIAFGFAGIYDEDEGERIVEGTHTTSGPALPQRAPAVPLPQPKAAPAATVAAPAAAAAPAPVVEPAAEPAAAPAPAAEAPTAPAPTGEAEVRTIGKASQQTLLNSLDAKQIEALEFCEAFDIKTIAELPSEKLQAATAWIDRYPQ